MFIWYRNLKKELIIIFPLFTNGITLLKKYSDIESLLNRHQELFTTLIIKHPELSFINQQLWKCITWGMSNLATAGQKTEATMGAFDKAGFVDTICILLDVDLTA